jgi:hypothetical protein
MSSVTPYAFVAVLLSLINPHSNSLSGFYVVVALPTECQEALNTECQYIALCGPVEGSTD